MEYCKKIADEKLQSSYKIDDAAVHAVNPTNCLWRMEIQTYFELISSKSKNIMVCCKLSTENKTLSTLEIYTSDCINCWKLCLQVSQQYSALHSRDLFTNVFLFI